jgi:hypothetical protein
MATVARQDETLLVLRRQQVDDGHVLPVDVRQGARL